MATAPLLTYAAHGARARLLEPAALVDGVGVQLREVLGQLAQLAAGDGAATAARRCEALLTLAAAVLPCALIDGDGDGDGDGDAQPAGGGTAPVCCRGAALACTLASLACGVRRAAVRAPAVATAADAPPKRGDLERCRPSRPLRRRPLVPARVGFAPPRPPRRPAGR